MVENFCGCCQELVFSRIKKAVRSHRLFVNRFTDIKRVVILQECCITLKDM